MEKEYEIDIKEIFIIIKRYIVFIFIFVFITTSISIVYVLLKPNIYRVSATLVKQKMPSIVLVKDNFIFEYDINKILKLFDFDYSNLTKDQHFMINFIKKNGFDKEIISGKLEKDYVFTSKGKFIHDFLKSLKTKKSIKNQKINFFSNIYMPFISGFSISKNKKEDITIITYTHPNRFFAYRVLTSFLKDGIKYLVNKNIKNLELQIKKYEKEVKNTDNLELKLEFANLIFTLLKQKAYIKTSKIYKLKNKPYIPNREAKIGPKRKTTIIVTFVASLVVAIVLVFVIEFIKHIKES